MEGYERLIQSLLAGDSDALAAEVEAALAAGVPAKEILDGALMKGMDIVGASMEAEEMFIPEVLMAAKAMANALEILKPRLAAADRAGAGKVVIGTVKGDLHDIGKNLVAMLLESSGFEVVDLGVDIAPPVFVAEARKHGARMICMSALLTTTMPHMKATVEYLMEAGLRESIKVLVGGAPVTPQFAEQIGADGFAADAGGAVKMARSLLQ